MLTHMLFHECDIFKMRLDLDKFFLRNSRVLWDLFSFIQKGFVHLMEGSK